MAPQGPTNGIVKMRCDVQRDHKKKKLKVKMDRRKYLRRKLKQGKASGEEKLELAGLERELG